MLIIVLLWCWNNSLDSMLHADFYPPKAESFLLFRHKEKVLYIHDSMNNVFLFVL